MAGCPETLDAVSLGLLLVEANWPEPERSLDHAKQTWSNILRSADLNGDEYLDAYEARQGIERASMDAPDDVTWVWSRIEDQKNGWTKYFNDQAAFEYGVPCGGALSSDPTATRRCEITISQMIEDLVASRHQTDLVQSPGDSGTAALTGHRWAPPDCAAGDDHGWAMNGAPTPSPTKAPTISTPSPTEAPTTLSSVGACYCDGLTLLGWSNPMLSEVIDYVGGENCQAVNSYWCLPSPSSSGLAAYDAGAWDCETYERACTAHSGGSWTFRFGYNTDDRRLASAASPGAGRRGPRTSAPGLGGSWTSRRLDEGDGSTGGEVFSLTCADWWFDEHVIMLGWPFEAFETDEEGYHDETIYQKPFGVAGADVDGDGDADALYGTYYSHADNAGRLWRDSASHVRVL